MKTFIIAATVLILNFYTSSYCQEITRKMHNEIEYDFKNDRLFKDSTVTKFGKSKVQKSNIGGIFISPMAGVSFPLGKFATFSNSGIQYGLKAEIAYSRLYPFIFGFIYEYQKNKGNADFTTVNFLTQFDTKITSIGGSLDIILNKYLKSDFTTPILTLEIKYSKVNRIISPATSLPDLTRDESLLMYTAGIGFTIYVFDLFTKYSYAKDYTNLSFQLRFHFPVIKF
ncbi:MAG: hypothetical protein ABIY50_02950 [Ignavibacteria bacterium]